MHAWNFVCVPWICVCRLVHSYETVQSVSLFCAYYVTIITICTNIYRPILYTLPNVNLYGCPSNLSILLQFLSC